MSKNRIISIVTLMSLALLGIIVLQSYWIRHTIDTEERSFDRNVYEALDQVADRLERIRIDLQGGMVPDGQWAMLKKSGFAALARRRAANLYQKNPDSLTTEDLKQLNELVNLTANSQDIEKILLSTLDSLLHERLKAHGINTEYNYVIKNSASHDIIYSDGHFAVVTNTESASSGITVPEWNIEYYDTDINSLKSPAKLLIHFPYRSRLVWQDVLPMLLAAIAFTGIIMFCFFYTLQIVFRQKKVSEMKTDFINNMTHEFKTPIATISLASETITNPLVSADTDKVAHFARIIRQENDRMHKQVERVLDMAKIGSREFELSIETIDLHALITQAIENINLQVESRNGEITPKLRAGKSLIEGDATHVSNAIHNLLDNANKYSPIKPEITIVTANYNNGIAVSVLDKGIGIAKDARKHVFDKFYRVHTGNLHDVKGFGLGLSYLKMIVDAHKGTVNVESELNKGSKFTIWFPLSQENE